MSRTFGGMSFRRPLIAPLVALLVALGLGCFAMDANAQFGGFFFKHPSGGGSGIAFVNAADLGNNGGSGAFSASYASGGGPVHPAGTISLTSTYPAPTAIGIQHLLVSFKP
jgi:hypothetical protein